jgi:hypothetical protein
MSYRWLAELKFRTTVTSYLWFHDLTRIDIDVSLDKFKYAAFQLMYQIADSTAGLKSMHSVRTRQVEFLGTFHACLRFHQARHILCE